METAPNIATMASVWSTSEMPANQGSTASRAPAIQAARRPTSRWASHTNTTSASEHHRATTNRLARSTSS